jgi:hypothetical protein
MLVRQRVPEHLDPRGQQDQSEHQEHPVEGRQRGRAQRDEQATEDQGPDDAVEQDPLLQRLRNGERTEQQHEHEQVVDAERLLDQVARVVLDSPVGAVLRPDIAAEQQREGDVERRPGQGLPHGDLVGLAGGDEVDDEQREYGADGQGPERGRGDRVDHWSSSD